jgi:hypothetical protein
MVRVCTLLESPDCVCARLCGGDEEGDESIGRSTDGGFCPPA